MRWWLRPERSSPSASVARWNWRSGDPAKLEPTSSRSALRFFSVNGTGTILRARPSRFRKACVERTGPSRLDMQVDTCLLSMAMGDVFKALADPTRRAILDELAERDDQTLFELCARLATKHRVASSRQAVSQHIDVLIEAGLIATRREGRYKFHHLDPRPLERIADRWLSASQEQS